MLLWRVNIAITFHLNRPERKSIKGTQKVFERGRRRNPLEITRMRIYQEEDKKLKLNRLREPWKLEQHQHLELMPIHYKLLPNLVFRSSSNALESFNFNGNSVFTYVKWVSFLLRTKSLWETLEDRKNFR